MYELHEKLFVGMWVRKDRKEEEHGQKWEWEHCMGIVCYVKSEVISTQLCQIMMYKASVL